MSEIETISLKDKFIKIGVGIFLFILIGMLIITLLPGDAEKILLQGVSGQNPLSIGKVGDETIPVDYFHSARRDCYYRYKDYLPSLANDQQSVDSCAYQTIKSIKVAKKVSEAIGFSVTERSIKEELSNQARRIQKESGTSAGYSKDETQSVDDIYRSMLKAAPINYRIDTMTAASLYEKVLTADLKKSDDESNRELEAHTMQMSLDIITISDEEMLTSIDASIQVPEVDIKKEYDEEKLKNALPKDAKGVEESFDIRKIFLRNRIKADLKQKVLSEKKAKMTEIKNSQNAKKLQEIAKLIGKKIDFEKNLTYANLRNLKSVNLASNKTFLKDMTETKFGVGSVGGPYIDGNKTVFVEFKEVRFAKPDPKKAVQKDEGRTTLLGFFGEISQLIAKDFPIYRNTGKVEPVTE